MNWIQLPSGRFINLDTLSDVVPLSDDSLLLFYHTPPNPLHTKDGFVRPPYLLTGDDATTMLEALSIVRLKVGYRRRTA